MLSEEDRMDGRPTDRRGFSCWNLSLSLSLYIYIYIYIYTYIHTDTHKLYHIYVNISINLRALHKNMIYMLKLFHKSYCLFVLQKISQIY